MAIVIFVIAERNDIESASSFIFLTGLVEVSLTCDSVLLEFQMGIHCVESGVFSLESFLSKIYNFCLLGVKSSCSHCLISNVEVFIKSLSLRNEMS